MKLSLRKRYSAKREFIYRGRKKGKWTEDKIFPEVSADTFRKCQRPELLATVYVEAFDAANFLVPCPIVFNQSIFRENRQ